MAGEENEGRMDLNLYLGLPQSPGRPHSLQDLGSVLALGSAPLLPSSATQETCMASNNPPADPLPTIDSNRPPYSPRSENYTAPYTPLLPILPEVEVLDAPYTPSITPALPTARRESLGTEGSIATNVPHLPVSLDPVGLAPSPVGAVELLAGSLPRRDLLQFPEFRFQRLIESNNRWQLRRFRSSVPYIGERSGASTLPSTTEQLICDIMSSQRSLRSNGKDKVNVEGVHGQGTEEEAEEKSKNVANFDCNVCLDVAKEPVVTWCGHLFCWPCLYRWLHVHSGHRECPVCKGEVAEANIIPIYGRGSSETDFENKSGDDGESGMKIPPRPRGHRMESFRQQQPISRRLGDGNAASWRRFIDEEIRTLLRFDVNRESSLLELLEACRRAIARVREQTAQWEEGNPESGSGTRDVGQYGGSPSTLHISAAGLPLDDGADAWQRSSLRGIGQFGLSEMLAALPVDRGRVVERPGASTSSQAGVFASSGNPQNPEPYLTRTLVAATQASDQGSASSTTAVIEEDVAVIVTSAERSSAGSSRSLRRRRRSRTSSSLDADGMLYECMRRRLN